MKRQRKAFTMIELMIAIVIVAILASVVAPMMRGRLEKAKWSEAMSGCSSVSTALRAWAAENAQLPTTALPTSMTALGFQAGDLNGKYFSDSCYVVSAVGTAGNPTYTITVTPNTGLNAQAPTGGSLTLNQAGVFTLTDSGGSVSTF